MADKSPRHSGRYIDLNDLVASRDYKLSITSPPDPEDQASTRRIEEASKALERRKDQALFFAALGMVVVSFLVGLLLLLMKGVESAAGKWGGAIVVLIVTALLGYVTGRQSR